MGAAEALAAALTEALAGLHPGIIMCAVALPATVLSRIISSIAATVLLVPLVMLTGAATGTDPRAPAPLVAGLRLRLFHHSNPPRVNALLMGPGGYAPQDYLKAGSIMTAVFIIISVARMYLPIREKDGKKMIIHQFFIPGLAHSSYLVAGNRTCAVIDPERDAGRYITAAQEMGLRITHVLETHLHADFISGHLDLAEATGAMISAPRSADCAFRHTPVHEGDELNLEDICFSVIETAGHTPESICYIATDTSRGQTPVALFSGDTLFVGDVGRPDLFLGRATELASSLFDNLRTKIMTLPDECEVYPAHGMGSLCGRAMAAKRTSTIGYEKKYNYALQIRSREEFIRALTSDMPSVPDHFSRCSEINRTGPALMRDLVRPVPIEPKSVADRIQADDAIFLDVRSYLAFSGMHIPGVWHIDLSGSFATQAGWVLPPDKDILLVVDDKRQSEEATLQLHRVGFDRVTGYIEGGMLVWGTAALPISRVPIISPEEAHALIRAHEAVLIDVRSREEWEVAHVKGSIHIPWHDLRTRYNELDPAKQYVIMCRGGQRASIAASILKRHGIGRIYNLGGGYTAFQKSGPV